MRKIKPVDCACGRPAQVDKRWDLFHVDCGRLTAVCWVGPGRKSELAAIKAWNRVMAIIQKEKSNET